MWARRFLSPRGRQPGDRLLGADEEDLLGRLAQPDPQAGGVVAVRVGGRRAAAGGCWPGRAAPEAGCAPRRGRRRSVPRRRTPAHGSRSPRPAAVGARVVGVGQQAEEFLGAAGTVGGGVAHAATVHGQAGVLTRGGGPGTPQSLFPSAGAAAPLAKHPQRRSAVRRPGGGGRGIRPGGRRRPRRRTPRSRPTARAASG